MRVFLTPEGEAQLALRRKWWRQNRPKAPDLFDQELETAIERIGSGPETFRVFAEKGGHVIRRCLMPKTQCHVYFEVRSSSSAWVLAASGGQRRHPPPIKVSGP
jgi:plasmid stabilization system protein ParE